MKERRVNKAEDTAGESLQLFTDDLTEMPIEKCTFSFSIWIAGSVPSYCFHISDRLTKEQFWSASLESQHHVDVQFVVKDKTFSAHKAVLAARSPVFAAEFTKEKPGQKDDHGDGLQQIIRIDDVDPASVEQFLYFLYTGEPVKSSLANEQLLNLADRYQVITLVNLCGAAMKNIDAQQIMSSLCKINSYAADLHKQASVLDSIHIRQDKETEIVHDKTSVFHFPWKFSNLTHAMSPGMGNHEKSIFEYQNEHYESILFHGS
ncbi:hypothetical protein DAPPUDRAFT_242279 [Daphnia pulex]|uniref:BTB domain-containing protein n=1 Tax=Daphnia pulex TaxID=6669 RepID=E9GGA0_DAPPU|nr:hypothetical protein DAPPUDRAFT_242279 [Daphnia pulex]|eukprot:EFX81532.1 hypothetical protein DAPPUDRAFT_242279 [Daphnia pulex]